MIVAWQFIARNRSIPDPSRRARCDWNVFVVLVVPNQGVLIILSLRDRRLFAQIPGNKLPGYDRSVPTGRATFPIAPGPDHADGARMSQSIRNRIPGTIREITSDPVMTEVVLDTAIGPVAAVITTRSANELGLKIGDSVHALVKATNVSVEKA